MHTEWVGSWASAQQIPDERYALPAEELTDTTLRQIVRLTLGGKSVRVRLSNAFGTVPLHVRSAHIARSLDPTTGTNVPGTDRTLMFSGRSDVVIPAGAEYLSDPVAGDLPAFCDLCISLHLGTLPSPQTGHPGARQISFIGRGDQTSAPEFTSFKQITQWYFLAAVEVLAPAGCAVVATLGDSMTDGRGSTTNGNNRWPDNLARRLQANPKTRHVGVVNAGSGGNRLLLDVVGPNGLARLNADVLMQTGVRFLIVFEGINDLGTATIDHEIPPAEHHELTRRIIAAYEQIIARCHARHVKVMGATILPYMGSAYYHPTSANEDDRQTINAWIREPGHFDAVADFDAAVRDPDRPDRLLPAYDSGDHLDPSPEGYQAMADVIPLEFFAQQAGERP